MAQLAPPGRSRSSSGVTVADLLRRNAPVPVRILDAEPTAVLSVGSLLRREGRDPGARAEPRGPLGARRVVVRGAAIAAGTLVVAGSVFGGAVLAETFLGPPPPLTGSDPAPAAQDGPAAPITSAAGAAPSAGSGAPTAWTEVAFPTRVATAPIVTTAAPRSNAAAAEPRSTKAPVRSTPTARKEAEGSSAKKTTTPKRTAAAQPAADASPSTSAARPRPDSGLLGAVVDPVKGLLGLG